MAYNIDIKEGLNTVEVFDGRKFTYRFTPATFSKRAPLLVISSARGTRVPSKFNRSDWNVLSVVDTFGRTADMSAYLGEKGNFFIKELLYELIQAAIKKCECNPRDNLYFYSSSIASGSGIGQGILSEARAVYLNSPIIRVHDTTIYKSKYMDVDKAIDFVIPPSMKDVLEADGVRFLKAYTHKKLPTFFVCESLHHTEPWLDNFLEEQTYYFVNACKEEGVEVHLELIDAEDHITHHTMQEVIGFFEKYTPPKYLDIMKVTTLLNKNELTVECIPGKDFPTTGDEEFAYYLMYKGEKHLVDGYKKSTTRVFELDDALVLDDLEVKGFVKYEGGKISKKVAVIEKK